MKILINEGQYKKLLSEDKLLAIQKLVDMTITNEYDFVCKVVISPPNNFNPQYSAVIYFKDVNSESMNIPNYFRKKEKVMNDVWNIIYRYTNTTVSLYQKNC